LVIGSNFELFSDLEAEKLGVGFEVTNLSLVVEKGLVN
jgi:hypothetical protein